MTSYVRSVPRDAIGVNSRLTNALFMAFVVGLAGGSASGKSRFLTELKRKLGDRISVLSLDDYYKPLADQQIDENGVVNFDLPEAIDQVRFSDDVKRLLSGNCIEIHEYTFNNPDRVNGDKKTIHPSRIIVIEGLFVFHFDEIEERFDLSVFIDANEDLRLQRRIERDKNERGIPMDVIMYQWNNHVVPAYNTYLKPARESADLVINNNVSFAKAFDVLSNYLLTKVV